MPMKMVECGICGWGTYWNRQAACVLLIPPFDGEFGDYSSLNPCYFDLDLSGIWVPVIAEFVGQYDGQCRVFLELRIMVTATLGA